MADNDDGATHYYGDGCDDDHGRTDHDNDSAAAIAHQFVDDCRPFLDRPDLDDLRCAFLDELAIHHHRATSHGARSIDNAIDIAADRLVHALRHPASHAVTEP